MPNELKVLVLIDQANLHGQATSLNKRFNIVKLYERLLGSENGVGRGDCIVYAPVLPGNPDGSHGNHDWLRHSGLQVVSKRAKRLPDGTVKCDMDVILALDAMELAREAKPDVIILASGDGDFSPLAIRLRRMGIRVEAASCKGSLAGELRAACQRVIELDEFFSKPEKMDESAVITAVPSVQDVA
ncbi:MAG: NYN domain-containing protein [bacterium]